MDVRRLSSRVEFDSLDQDQFLFCGKADCTGNLVIEVVPERRRTVPQVTVLGQERTRRDDLLDGLHRAHECRYVRDAAAEEAVGAVVSIPQESPALEVNHLKEGWSRQYGEAKDYGP